MPRFTLRQLCMLFVVLALLFGTIHYARLAFMRASRMHGSNRMKQVVIGLHNYSYTYERLPLAAATDDSGEPTCSWRVIVVPLEGAGMSNPFPIDDSIPWDSPANAQRHAGVNNWHGGYFDWDFHERSPDWETNIFAITGKGTAFDGGVHGSVAHWTVHRFLARIENTI